MGVTKGVAGPTIEKRNACVLRTPAQFALLTALHFLPGVLPMKKASSCSPLRVVAGLFALAFSSALYLLFNTVVRLQTRLDTTLRSASSAPTAQALPAPPPPAPALASHPAALAQAAAPAPAPPARAHGLQKFLSTTAEMDAFFSYKSSVQQNGFAQHPAGDLPEVLIPFLHHAFMDYVERHGRDAAGGFIDAGANIGDFSAPVLHAFSVQSRLLYHHALAPDLQDPEHATYANARHTLPFALLLEPSPRTRGLLQRRADAGVWGQAYAQILPIAASNASGEAPFCYLRAGSENSGLASGASGVLAGSSDRVCERVRTAPLSELLDEKVGSSARVFLLKVDVEGADALVLQGAARLFRDKRVSFVVFENHAKWVSRMRAAALPLALAARTFIPRRCTHAAFSPCLFSISLPCPLSADGRAGGPWGVPIYHRGRSGGRDCAGGVQVLLCVSLGPHTLPHGGHARGRCAGGGVYPHLLHRLQQGGPVQQAVLEQYPVRAHARG